MIWPGGGTARVATADGAAMGAVVATGEGASAVAGSAAAGCRTTAVSVGSAVRVVSAAALVGAAGTCSVTAAVGVDEDCCGVPQLDSVSASSAAAVRYLFMLMK